MMVIKCASVVICGSLIEMVSEETGQTKQETSGVSSFEVFDYKVEQGRQVTAEEMWTFLR